MTITQMFGQSAIVMFFGMSVVFGFLIILIISITLVGKAISALGLDKDLKEPAKVKTPVISQTVPVVEKTNDNATTAVIAAAVTAHRKTHS